MNNEHDKDCWYQASDEIKKVAKEIAERQDQMEIYTRACRALMKMEIKALCSVLEQRARDEVRPVTRAAAYSLVEADLRTAGVQRINIMYYDRGASETTTVHDGVHMGSGSLMVAVDDLCEKRKKALHEKRAPVQQSTRRKKPAGTVSWEEHLEAYHRYVSLFGSDQSAERLAERHGFGYDELVALLGREPTTWKSLKDTP